MKKDLLIGITLSSVIHTDTEELPSLETQFQMVKESGVYDYIDKSPSSELVDDFLKYSEKYDLPIHAGGWYYTLGKDEDLLKENLQIAARLGSKVHNTQISFKDVDGNWVTNEQIVEIYLKAYEWGQKFGVDACFEVHVNMWSEHFGRVAEVAKIVEAKGVPFFMTLDHSHVIFKIDNPEAQEVLNMRPDVESGKVILDPFEPNSVTAEWINSNYVRHCHARSAVPNGPKNIWCLGEDGQPGRGIQYPFIKPEIGQWHSEWQEENLEPWKEVIRQLLHYHSSNDKSCLGQISTEFIPWMDYGGGAKYSIFENSVACAKWIKETWEEEVK